MSTSSNNEENKIFFNRTVSHSHESQNAELKTIMITVQHKIRNLEKRKAKLELYKSFLISKKSLNKDQLDAVAKYDDVVSMLDFSREIYEQLEKSASEKKQVVRKDNQKQRAQDLEKIQSVILIQSTLEQLQICQIRKDFLLGRNNAVKISEFDLNLLDQIYLKVSPKRAAEAPGTFITDVDTLAPAEHLLAIAQGSEKEIYNSSYKHVQELIYQIHDSKYFLQPVASSICSESCDEMSDSIVEDSEIFSTISEITLDRSLIFVSELKDKEQDPSLFGDIHNTQNSDSDWELV